MTVFYRIISIFLSFFYFYRKISAHEFERGGLLKPIVNTIDGTPTFLSVGSHNETTQNSASHHHNHHHSHHHLHQPMANSTNAGRPQRLSRNELKQLDEKELIFELVRYRTSVS